MTLYEVEWSNNEPYEDHMSSTKVFSTLEKATAYYNKEQFGYPCYTETLTLSSFDEDDERQIKTMIAKRVLPSAEDEGYNVYNSGDGY